MSFAYRGYKITLNAVQRRLGENFFITFARNIKYHFVKQLWEYLKNPKEFCSYDFSVRTMPLSAILCLLVPLFFKVLTASVFVITGVDLPAMTSDKSVLPLWFLIIIPPIIEELGFRLPLKRNRFNLCISLTVIAFIFSKVFFAGGLYSEHLLYRIVFAVILSVTINFVFGKWLLKVRFQDFFYSIAILFAILHIVNYSHQALNVSQWMYVVCYACAKIPGSILYGYARMKHGMLFCIVIHIISNLPLMII